MPQSIVRTIKDKIKNDLKRKIVILAGRHFYYRLYPFDIKELVQSGYKKNPEVILDTLVKVGDYPEPFLIGDCMNINAGATAQRWLNILEDLFVIFKITPYSKEISRSLKKEPKYYFFDSGLVEGDNGAKLENIVAYLLLKEVHRLLDVDGIEMQLNYLKVKGGREIDFIIHSKDKSIRPTLIGSKYKESDASPNFKLFETHFKSPKKLQLVQTLKRNVSTQNQIEVTNASEWLAELSLI